MIRLDGAFKFAVARDAKGDEKMVSGTRRQPSQDSVFLAWTFESLNDAVDAAVRHASVSQATGEVSVVMRLVNGEFPDSGTLRKLQAAQVELVSTAEELSSHTTADAQILNEVRQLLVAPKSTVTCAVPALTAGDTVKVAPEKRPSKEDRQKFVDEEVYGRHLAY